MKSEWISVKERLPEHGQFVLCFGKWGVQFSHVFIDFDDKLKFGNWRTGCGDCPNITHWQPLPDPPLEAPDGAE
jgi:hypothetical protein